MKIATVPLVTGEPESRLVKETNRMLPRFLHRMFAIALAMTSVAIAQQSKVAQASANYGKLPLVFEANRGQTDPEVKFLARGVGYTAFLTNGGLTVSLRSQQGAVAGSA